MRKNDNFRKIEKLTEVRYELLKLFPWTGSLSFEITQRLQAWFCSPENQKRPVIINLWGPSGVGKTSFIKELVREINLSNLLVECSARKSGSITDFLSKLKTLSTINDQVNGIFIIDDIQYLFQEKPIQVFEIPSSNSPIWQLLSEGKMEMDPLEYELHRVKEVYMDFINWFNDGIKIEKGLVSTECIDFYEERDIPLNMNTGAIKRSDLINTQPPQFIFSKREAKILYESKLHDFTTYTDFISHIRTMDEGQIKLFLDEMLRRSISPVHVDFSQSVFFVIGTLDEAYSKSHESLGLSPEQFFQEAMQVDSRKIKKLLLPHLSLNQLSHLGAHHLIFPCLSADAYFQFIKNHLHLTSQKFKEETGILLTFEENIQEKIFNDGVIPALGLRPLIHTMDHLIGDFLPSLHMAAGMHHSIEQITVRRKENGYECFMEKPNRNPFKFFFPLPSSK
ncbi:ATPase family associated with various cellular activities (AAA) [Algoriphagus ornithinivorans]|uniref:ATPase family associated with various cellular activities (AAA) n=1 Tax=Algoriphagus ornithinivorans TaxID=226506 RepID=A0A1I5IJE0_9BACT|nr:AAA family ATPase [Algoriphagus ornithinivorans]SFO60350.1 ATPase family associated with various cellular activities (AAA) [Algoriphagus ornithinivorans]